MVNYRETKEEGVRYCNWEGHGETLKIKKKDVPKRLHLFMLRNMRRRERRRKFRTLYQEASTNTQRIAVIAKYLRLD